ncbi:MAG: hypothetical protein EZS28_016325 [Streblomastix strix]|uniref:Uncharacterized protein n=1 Tax=Streblomastix strix TaxID=222440 RepID=A0A5J4VZZ2_9EUKA|nr:MAG: hypothetical protein EZS28_016325 [Streblomastix strix]
MGLWSRLKNFGSKILGIIKKAADLVASTLNKVLGTLAGPVETLHSGIGAAISIGSRLAGGVINGSFELMLFN